MPQKAKFDKKEILDIALKIVEENGIEYLTARFLGQKLNSSSRPIFTTFNNMDEVINGVYDKANKIYQDYVHIGLNQDIAFKGVGTAYILFAKDHPNLFKLLFMKEQDKIPDSNHVLGLIEDSYKMILDSIINSYKVSENFARKLYLHMWIYTHGIATLIVNKMCTFDGEEISKLLTTMFKSLLRNGEEND